MHDLTSAAHYGQRLVLLDKGLVVADGPPAEVLTPERLARVYGARVEVLARADGPAVLPLREADAGSPGAGAGLRSRSGSGSGEA